MTRRENGTRRSQKRRRRNGRRSAMLAAVLMAAHVASISPGVFDVSAYGAAGDGSADDTSAIRKAAAALKAAGGGELRFPAGKTYLTAAFNLSSNCRMTLGAGTTIRGNAANPDWPLLTVSEIWRWFGQARDMAPGTEAARLMHNPLVFAWRAENVTIDAAAGGTIDGGGEPWWKCGVRNGSGSFPLVGEAPCSGYSRPQLIFFSNVSKASVLGLTTLNPPDWNVHFGWCDDVLVDRLRSFSPAPGYNNSVNWTGNAPNADGVDIDASQRVLVQNSEFTVSDDAICIKSGIDWFGRRFGRPTRDVLVRNCTIHAGAGPTIGSEMSGGVFNVTFEDIILGAVQVGPTLKSARGRGGVVDGVTFRRIRSKQCVIDGTASCEKPAPWGHGDVPLATVAAKGTQVQYNLGYGTPGFGNHSNRTINASSTPHFKNVLFEDCEFVGGGVNAAFVGLPEAPAEAFEFRNTKFRLSLLQSQGTVPSPPLGQRFGKCEYVQGICTGGTPFDSCPPCFKMEKVDWLERRKQLVNAVFGSSAQGKLPTRSAPDVGPIKITGPQVFGSSCSKYGYCSAEAAAYGNNMSMFKWTMRAKVNETYTVAVNSTVFHTLNTSGVAPQTYPDANGPPALPGGGWFKNASLNTPAMYAGGGPGEQSEFKFMLPGTAARGETVVLFHHGHSQPCNASGCHIPWIDDTTEWLNSLGFDSMVLQMPGYQCNYEQPLAQWSEHWGGGCNHTWWGDLEKQGVATGRFFVEPVVLTINYALSLGYRRVVMMGLSGGGWTTTLAAALDPRIQLSLPVAGSVPCSFDHTSWDFEQFCSRPYNEACDYECQYVLASLEKERTSVQMIHEFDPCCFHAHGRHDAIRAYNKRVQRQIQGHFETSATVGNIHEVNHRDKIVAGMLIDALDAHGVLSNESGLGHLPFNTLRRWGP